MDNYAEEIKNSIEEADAVIVGIGSEFMADIDTIIDENETYGCCKNYLSQCDSVTEQYIKYCIYYFELSKGQNKIINTYIDTYRKLKSILDNKRYFILTTNTDDIIYEAGFDENNIAAPCGSILRLQNGCNCDSMCQSANPVLEKIYNIILEIKQASEKQNITQESASEYIDKIKNLIPGCESCNTPKKFNVHNEKGYDESGYMPQWERYTKWLQLTLNKKIVLLELGVDFEVPTVIRWPFEKMALLNYKAYLYRINRKLPQIPVEIKDKGASVKENSFEFINANF